MINEKKNEGQKNIHPFAMEQSSQAMGGISESLKTIVSRLWKARFIAMTTIAVMLLCMTSCSSDDDEPESMPPAAPEEEITNDMSQLHAPAMSAESAKYTLASNSEGIQSIELTESGIYHINYGYNYASGNKQRDNKHKSVGGMAINTIIPRFVSRESVSTRYGGGTNVGSFIKVADGEYILEGYGSITISGDADHAMEIILNPENGESTTVGAQKEETYSLNDAATVALCRAWTPATIHMRLDLDGVPVADQSGPYSDYFNIVNRVVAQFMQAFKNKYGQYFDEEDFEYEPITSQSEIPTMIIFSRSGSYLVEYTHDCLDVKQWKWLNLSNQTIHYSHNLDDLYSEDSADATVKFNGKNVIIHTVNTDSESDEGITITITGHVWETATER